MLYPRAVGVEAVELGLVVEEDAELRGRHAVNLEGALPERRQHGKNHGHAVCPLQVAQGP